MKGLGCQTDLAEVQRGSVSATKQAKGNQFSPPKVMSCRQLRGKASIAASVRHETTASASAKPHYTYGKDTTLSSIVLDHFAQGTDPERNLYPCTCVVPGVGN